MKKGILTFMMVLLISVNCFAEEENNLGITAKSAVLMEASTGQVIYEVNSDEKLSPASITKIMTLILIFEKLDEGKIMLDDFVTTSDYAQSMGGSQVFLESGEQQTVETMIKCIVVASGNDASVAMAEFISGSEKEFVAEMNKKAAELGMKNTHFEDCCGLTDSDNHYTTAKDVAIMSRELIYKHPEVKKYSTIWMENITHVTKKGNKEFGLSNTNKLLKMNCNFEVTGLKTGSTSKAKYCLSATGQKDGIELIAVVMAAPDYKARFAQAQTLLNYGYANCALYKDDEKTEFVNPKVKGGKKEEVKLQQKGSFSYLALKGEKIENMKKTVVYEENVKAPVQKGDVLGRIVYTLEGKEVGAVDLVAEENVGKAKFSDYLVKAFRKFLI